MVTNTMLTTIDIERLGNEANYEDLARVRCAVEIYAGQHGMEIGEAFDAVYGNGDFWPLVMELTPAWESENTEQYLSGNEVAHYQRRGY